MALLSLGKATVNGPGGNGITGNWSPNYGLLNGMIEVKTGNGPITITAVGGVADSNIFYLKIWQPAMYGPQDVFWGPTWMGPSGMLWSGGSPSDGDYGAFLAGFVQDDGKSWCFCRTQAASW